MALPVERGALDAARTGLGQLHAAGKPDATAPRVEFHHGSTVTPFQKAKRSLISAAASFGSG
jgi:hypothetical protein